MPRLWFALGISLAIGKPFKFVNCYKVAGKFDGLWLKIQYWYVNPDTKSTKISAICFILKSNQLGLRVRLGGDFITCYTRLFSLSAIQTTHMVHIVGIRLISHFMFRTWHKNKIK